VREVYSAVVIKPLRFGLVREAEGLQEMIFTNILRKEDIDAGLERVRLCPWEKVEAFEERAAEVVESIGRFDDVPIMRSSRGFTHPSPPTQLKCKLRPDKPRRSENTSGGEVVRRGYLPRPPPNKD
jgi:hypothetical protein